METLDTHETDNEHRSLLTQVPAEADKLSTKKSPRSSVLCHPLPLSIEGFIYICLFRPKSVTLEVESFCQEFAGSFIHSRIWVTAISKVYLEGILKQYFE